MMGLYWVIDIFSRAAAHEPLTPLERSLLRAWDGFLVVLLIAVMMAAAPLVMGRQPFSWQALLVALLPAVFQTALMALLKLQKAQGDNNVPVVPGVPAPLVAEPVNDRISESAPAVSGQGEERVHGQAEVRE